MCEHGTYTSINRRIHVFNMPPTPHTRAVPPPDSMICQITEPLRVKPFSINSMYGFMGTCEHVAFSSCQSDDEFNVRVTVDFLTESLENGAVGLHVNDLRFVSREDGSFDDGGQTPLVGSTTTSRQYTPTPSSRVDVDIGENVTSIVYTVTDVQPSHPSFIEIVIVHTHGNIILFTLIVTSHLIYKAAGLTS